jgi:hypothetical protein
MDRGKRSEFVQQLLCEIQRNIKMDAATAGLRVMDGLGEVRLAALAPPTKLPQPLIVQRIEQSSHRRDAELFIHLPGPLRSQTRHSEQRPQPSRNPGTQLVELLDRPGLPQFDDLAREMRTDIRDRVETLRIQTSDLGVLARHSTGSLLIRTNLERVASRDREQLSELL